MTREPRGRARFASELASPEKAIKAARLPTDRSSLDELAVKPWRCQYDG